MNDPVITSALQYPMGLFEGTGIELEYMIVDSSTLDVLPICDKVLSSVSGTSDNEVYPESASGIAAWSNELALHVLEFKTTEPLKKLDGADSLFHRQVVNANNILKPYGAKLMPTAMHPWMNPDKEFRIWPHGSREIYNAFDSIFGCKGHGWSNLQSMHINLPFKNNDEFIKLHTAIRILLPIINALTASSPFKEGGYSGFNDTRMEVYRTNSAKIPSITGYIIPEPVRGIDEYRTIILERIYSDLKPYDPEGRISHEWVNARGCIPRFSRGSIEIRTSDIQECPAADIACARLIIEVLKNLADQSLCDFSRQLNFNTSELYDIIISVIKEGDSAIIRNEGYLDIFRLKPPCTSIEIWQALAERLTSPDFNPPGELSEIFRFGNLSSRILKKTGISPDKNKLRDIYNSLALCLASNRQFIN